MALDFSTYNDPSSYITEVIVPSGVNIPSQPFALGLIGVGSRKKKVTNEPVKRGIVRAESLTLAGSGPYTATLANRGTRKLGDTKVTRTLNSLAQTTPDSFVSFAPATLQGATAATFNLGTTKAFVLEMDGRPAITCILVDDGAGVTPVVTQGAAVGLNNSAEFTATWDLGGASAASVTAAQIAQSINAILNAATSTALGTTLGYGSGYGNATGTTGVAEATTLANTVTITSTVTTPASDIRISAATPSARNASTLIFGAASKDAATVIRIAAGFYNASATWTVDYVAINDDEDVLAHDDTASNIILVGTSQNSGNLRSGIDWRNNSGKVNFDPDTASTYTSAVAAPYTITSGSSDTIILNFDGKGDVTVDFNGAGIGSAAGYTDLSGGAVTAANLADDINAIFASRAKYGARYQSVASAVTIAGSIYLKLTSPTQGKASSITIKQPSGGTASAITAIFGTFPAAATTAGYTTIGTGSRPADGSVYYVTYEYTKPTADYGVPFRFFDPTSAKAQVGDVSANVASFNPLAQAIELAFRNGAQIVYTIQANDTTTEGTPTRQEVLDCLEAAKVTAGITEILVVGEPGTRLDINTDENDHLEIENSATEKHPRRGWFGAARGTAIGDKDTAGTQVFRSTQTFQVSPSSPARGRMFNVVGPQSAGITYDTRLSDDGSTIRLSLDDTYLAVCVAARRSALAPWDTLTRKTITGPNLDDITTPWKPAERKLLAGNGSLVVTFDGAKLIMLDAMSTEGGGGGLDAFKIDSTSFAKDVVVQKVNQALDKNIIGLVPFDLADFIIDIKLIIAAIISGEITNQTIAPFRDLSTGVTRGLDPASDIVVQQSTVSKTRFSFKFWFNLRYPALLLDGQYSVDAPFFSIAA